MQLPSDFICFAQHYFNTEYNDFIHSLKKDVPTSIRINSRKANIDYYLRCCHNDVAWSRFGCYLKERPSFIFDPLLHAGAYYVQEASSMFLEQTFKQYVQQPIKVLDLCAAPGGKSTHILSLLPEKSLLVANEVIRSRAAILVENITKWGNSNVIVTNNDPAAFSELTHFFDVVLVDAPCSGEGMFRKDLEAIHQWSLKNVALCAERQQRILSDILPCLKPGGMLIYSTCTYNRTENEDNVQWLTQHFNMSTLPINTEEEWQIATPIHPHVYHFFPHKVNGEGFTLCAFRKNEDNLQIKNKKQKTEKNNSKKQSSILQWLKDSDNYILDETSNQTRAIPTYYFTDYHWLKNKLRVVSGGIHIAETKGNIPSPTQAFALSNSAQENVFNEKEIDWQTAIMYLRKESISLSPETPKGYILLKYKGKALGFVKNIGNRTNNLYPQEWRIKTRFLPEKPVDILQQ